MDGRTDKVNYRVALLRKNIPQNTQKLAKLLTEKI